MMETKIALAGNPNSGKTTLFNSLTGNSQYVGNWPGVTVEKKEGRLKNHRETTIQDLPGIYSLSPYTLEEVITRSYLVTERPDVVINIVDGTNIERNLYLTTQLLEIGIPVLVAINMIDVVRKRGDRIDIGKLSASLGCVVMEMSALKGEGSMAVAERAIEIAHENRTHRPLQIFDKGTGQAIGRIQTMIEGKVEQDLLGWYGVKLFERDKKVLEQLDLGSDLQERIEQVIAQCEKQADDDSESLVTNQRYSFVSDIVGKAVRRKAALHGFSASDNIDRIVTNRVLALPIFFGVMFLVYYISISTIGDFVTGWTNDTLFGTLISGNLQGWMETIGIVPWLTSLVIDGIVGGVGAVLGFVPQMLILFFLLSILEDVGYMARVAFIMDKIFRKVGLSGKSFIPMLISSGCGVPGVMASRTIEQERDRKITIMTTTFIPCGAKMPIIALFAGALFGGSGLVATSAYFIGFAAVITSGVMLKKTRMFAGDPAPFVIELPSYHIPSPRTILRSTWDRGWSFIKRAGTIILVSAIILWFLQSFGFENGAFAMVEDNNTSLLAAIGRVLALLFLPLGFGSWKAAVATITGLIAKENVVGTFGVLYGFAEVAEDGAQIWPALARDFTPLTAYSFMIFNLLCAPCFAAIGAIRQEMNSAKWTWLTVGYMTGFAYVGSLIVYQLGMFLGTGSFGFGTLVAFALLVATGYFLFRKNPYQGKTDPGRSSLSYGFAGQKAR
jgi:ferrous iron transport protein B